jgi:MFS family permease
MRNAIVASVLGWSLDLFDLFILQYVAPVVGALFFPSSVPTLSLAAVYASFAVTLLMRPVGSAVFGHYADVYGRKNAMLMAIVGVGISTAAFGLLPTIALPQRPLAQSAFDLRWWRGLLSDFGLSSFLKVVNGVPNSVSSLILMGAKWSRWFRLSFSGRSAIL